MELPSPGNTPNFLAPANAVRVTFNPLPQVAQMSPLTEQVVAVRDDSFMEESSSSDTIVASAELHDNNTVEMDDLQSPVKKVRLFNIPYMNSMKLVIPLHSLYWSIHTKDESKRGTAFAVIFGGN